MTAKDLIKKLSVLPEDTEIIGGIWNGRVDTYTMLDRLSVYPYDAVSADFYGTPGAFDDGLLRIKSKDIVYLGSSFEDTNPHVSADRRIIWRMARILRMHRSTAWKKDQIHKLLTRFTGE